MTPIDLRSIVSLEEDDVEDLFGSCFASEGGPWPGRGTDGVAYLRIVQREPERISVCGHMWVLDDEPVRAFWLDLELDPEGVVAWVARYDPIANSPGRALNVIHVLDHAAGTAWRVTASGHAEIREGTLLFG
jgi:hypothetical protein